MDTNNWKEMSNFDTKITFRKLELRASTDNFIEQGNLICLASEFISFCITKVLLEWESMLSIYNSHIF